MTLETQNIGDLIFANQMSFEVMKEYQIICNMGSLILLTLIILILLTFGNSIFLVEAQGNNTVDEIRVQGGVWSLAIDPDTDQVYVIAADSNSIFEIDGTTNKVSNQYFLGGRPMDTIAINPRTSTIYTILQNGSIVTLNTVTNDLSLISNSAIRSPVQISVNPANNKLYVTSSYYNETYIINGNTSALENTITEIQSPWRISVNPNTNMIYVISLADNTLNAIDGTTDKIVAAIPVVPRPSSVSINPINNMIYVINDIANRISVLNGTRNSIVDTIQRNFTEQNGSVGGNLAVDYDSNIIFAFAQGSNVVDIIDGSKNVILDAFHTKTNPRDIGFDSHSNTLYTTHYPDSYVSAVNVDEKDAKKFGSGDSIFKTSADEFQKFGGEEGHSKRGIAVNTNTNVIYAIDSSSNKITVLDGDSNNVMGRISIAAPATDIITNPNTNTVYVLSAQSNSVYGIDGYTNAVVSNITLDGSLRSIAINPETNMIYVTNNNYFLFDLFTQNRNAINSLYVIDGNTNTLVANFDIDVGDDIAIDDNRNMVYVSNKSLIHGRYELIDQITVLSDLADDARAFGTDISESLFILDNFVVDKNVITDLTVNPVTGILYAVVTNTNGKDKFVYGIDPYQVEPSVISNITIPSVIESDDDIAVNPNTNKIYVAGGSTGRIYVIDATSNVFQQNVTTGKFASDLALNEKTNIIYAGSTESQEIDAINGKTNKLLAKLTLRIDPPTAGYLECNKKQIFSTYSINTDVGTEVQCEAKSYEGFEFSSWSGNLPLESQTNSKLDFKLSNGTLTANFIIPVKMDIPIELLISVIAGPIIGWLIAFYAQRRKEISQRRSVSKILNSIDTDLRQASKRKDEDKFDNMIRLVQEEYRNGRISELQYEALYNIITYFEKISKN